MSCESSAWGFFHPPLIPRSEENALTYLQHIVRGLQEVSRPKQIGASGACQSDWRDDCLPATWDVATKIEGGWHVLLVCYACACDLVRAGEEAYEQLLENRERFSAMLRGEGWHGCRCWRCDGYAHPPEARRQPAQREAPLAVIAPLMEIEDEAAADETPPPEQGRLL